MTNKVDDTGQGTYYEYTASGKVAKRVWARGNPPITTTYGYGQYSSRLQTVSDGPYSAMYSYVANSPLVEQIILKESGTTRMTTTKQYDKLNRLASIRSAPSDATQLPLAFVSQYNSANQRVRVDLHDGSYWIYDYDSLGQVKSGKKYFTDNTPVPGQQFEYAHDDIGNRISTGGRASAESSYNVNSRNQYTSRTVAERWTS